MDNNNNNQSMYWVTVSFEAPQVHVSPMYAETEENAKEIVLAAMKQFKNVEIVNIQKMTIENKEHIERQMNQQMELPLENGAVAKEKMN